MTMLQHALEYRTKHGFNVFPLSHDKKPLGAWKQWQTEVVTEEQIVQWWTKDPNANIGIITGPVSNLLIIDLDIYKDKELIKRVYNLIPKGIATPICQTPRGGLHLYFRYPEGSRITQGTGKPYPHCDYKGLGGMVTAPPSVNGDKTAYVWNKGRSISEVGIQPAPQALIDALTTNDYNDNKRLHTPVKLFSEGSRDNDLFHIAHLLARGGAPQEETSDIIRYISRKCEPPFTEKEAMEKVKSAYVRQSNNLAQDVREWVMTTSDYFLTTDCYNGLQVTTRTEKKAVLVTLLRLKEEGLIEKCGNRTGGYRLVNRTIERMDLTAASTDPLDIQLPLGEERLVRIYRKNIIVVAGTPNAGKTAWLLNAAKLNMDKHHVLYCNSEMDVSELKVRLNEFGDCSMEKWNNVEFIERSGDYADVIQPDAVNIIDFLEISDEFWRVGGLLKEIHDKLKGGIAIIGLQMNPMNFATRKRNDYGMGGARGLEKPRLYLAMHPGLMVMVKAKIWANHHVNPNGMVCRFKILHGCAFMNATEWHKESQEE